MDIRVSNTPDLPEMTSRAAEVKAEQNAPIPPANPVDEKKTKLHKQFRDNIDLSKAYRRKLVQNWTVNIDYRRGKPFASQSDDDQVAVNLDWSLTKTKQASLFSQIPQVRVNHHPDSAAAGPGLAKFEAKLNDTLVVAGIESAMDEVLPDCINAAGFGVVMVSYEAIMVPKEVPKPDLSIYGEQAAEILATKMLPDGTPLEMEMIPQPVAKRYVIERISPADYLWPVGFMGSNFDKAPWKGRSGRISWPEAVVRFGLSEEDKEKVIGEEKTVLDRLNQDVEKENVQPERMVEFDEVFFKEHSYIEGVQSYDIIHHLVFVTGKDEPVIDEQWKGQKIDEATGQLVGATKDPLRVLTLTYISDEAIPPSDSAIGRPQVNEINKSRTHMINQMARNLPIRWGDINRLDPAIMQSLMKGTWQNIIPVQGDGSRVLGEVARADHPKDDYQIDQIAKNDLREEWTIGPNQQGSGEEVETKGESAEIANSFRVREGRERAKVSSFFVGIAEVLGGLLCIFEDPATFGEGFSPAFSTNLAFSILADSTVLVDANQRLQRLNGFLNTYAKSGFIHVEPVLREIAILTGLDPNAVIKAPDPQSPPPPNISFRLSGAADLMNPLCLATFLAEGKPPTVELIEQAKGLIQAAVMMPVPPAQPQLGPDGMPMPPGPPPPTPTGDANPDMTILPKIAKRSDDPSAGGKE